MNRSNRIERAFERRFLELLGELGARQRDKGLAWLFAHALERSSREPTTASQALAEENISLADKARRFCARRAQHPPVPCPILICDAGLGGLARWLRASGCDAHWTQDISDGELVAEAERLGAVIITTDSFLLDRRPIAQRRVRAIWVPPSLTKTEQLRLVVAELGVAEQPSRCMRCGGELIAISKEAAKDRIPPKTYRWIDDYFECRRCGQLFWEGTHWQRVKDELNRGLHKNSLSCC